MYQPLNLRKCFPVYVKERQVSVALMSLSHFSSLPELIIFLLSYIRCLPFFRLSWKSLFGKCPQLCVFCSASSGESVAVSVFIFSLLLFFLPCFCVDWFCFCLPYLFFLFSLLSLLSHLDHCTLRLLAENERIATFCPALRDRLAQAQDTCIAKVCNP